VFDARTYSARNAWTHTSGSEPAMAKTVESVRERIMPWTPQKAHCAVPARDTSLVVR
jgi:hypothetical protein